MGGGGGGGLLFQTGTAYLPAFSKKCTSSRDARAPSRSRLLRSCSMPSARCAFRVWCAPARKKGAGRVSPDVQRGGGAGGAAWSQIAQVSLDAVRSASIAVQVWSRCRMPEPIALHGAYSSRVILGRGQIGRSDWPD